MTIKEEIKKQAEIYTDNRDNYVEWSDGWEAHNDIKFVEKAFIEGAKWADNNINIFSIWNDINNVPSDNKSIIYLTKNGKIGIIKAIKSNKWYWYFANKYSIIKWAYINNLLPKQLGNSEQLKRGKK